MRTVANFERLHLRRTSLISIGLAAVLIGLFLAFYGGNLKGVWLLSLLPVVLIGWWAKQSVLWLLLVVTGGISIGLWRGGIVYQQLARYQPLYGQTITISAQVADDISYNQQRHRFEFHVTQVSVDAKKLPGRVQVIVFKDPELGRGDQVQVSGTLRPSQGTARQGTLTTKQLRIIQSNTSWLEKLRRNFFTVIQQALPEPQASLGLGYLIGLRASIPSTLSDQLAVVGLTHIVAVSGYNLTIIVSGMRRLFARRSVYQATVFSALLLIGFIAVAGSSAPINRAAVISAFSLLAWYYGRPLKPVLLLLLSGVVTAFINPLYIWGDPGWYLSFLAFAGILILAPIVRASFFKKNAGVIRQILLETLCAQLCTLPYVLYLFGGVSIIAPLANLLVLPLVPFIMLLIFMVGVIGMLVPHVAAFLGLIPSSLLSLQLWLIENLSKVPGAHLALTISAPMMLLLFVAIIGLAIVLYRKVRSKNNTQLLETDYNLL